MRNKEKTDKGEKKEKKRKDSGSKNTSKKKKKPDEEEDDEDMDPEHDPIREHEDDDDMITAMMKLKWQARFPRTCRCLEKLPRDHQSIPRKNQQLAEAASALIRSHAWKHFIVLKKLSETNYSPLQNGYSPSLPLAVRADQEEPQSKEPFSFEIYGSQDALEPKAMIHIVRLL